MKDVSVTLVNESCFSFLKELESNSIDLALIDPPYEVSRETNFKSGEAKGKDTDRFRVSMDYGFKRKSTRIEPRFSICGKNKRRMCKNQNRKRN